MIITVYNKEQYLNNLFGSIFSQDLTNVELIVVNDGSTDNSLKIISNYKIDKLINFEENIGIPSSRNRGIRESEGDYLWFIDAVDLIVTGSINRIKDFIDKSTLKKDIILSNSYIENSNLFSEKLVPMYQYSDIFKNFYNMVSTDIFLFLLILKLKANWNIWCHIFNRNFLINRRLFFDEKMIINEDVDWFIRVLLEVSTFDIIEYPIYIHRINMDSFSRSLNLDKFKVSCEINLKWYNYFNEYRNEYPKSSILMRYKMYNTFLAMKDIYTKQRGEYVKVFSDFLSKFSDVDELQIFKRIRELANQRQLKNDNINNF